jgi:hypothetical protein
MKLAITARRQPRCLLAAPAEGTGLVLGKFPAGRRPRKRVCAFFTGGQLVAADYYPGLVSPRP